MHDNTADDSEQRRQTLHDIIHEYVCKMVVAKRKTTPNRRNRETRKKKTTFEHITTQLTTGGMDRLMLARAFHAVHSLPTTFEPSGQTDFRSHTHTLFTPDGNILRKISIANIDDENKLNEYFCAQIDEQIGSIQLFIIMEHELE